MQQQLCKHCRWSMLAHCMKFMEHVAGHGACRGWLDSAQEMPAMRVARGRIASRRGWRAVVARSAARGWGRRMWVGVKRAFLHIHITCEANNMSENSK